MAARYVTVHGAVSKPKYVTLASDKSNPCVEFEEAEIEKWIDVNASEKVLALHSCSPPMLSITRLQQYCDTPRVGYQTSLIERACSEPHCERAC